LWGRFSQAPLSVRSPANAPEMGVPEVAGVFEAIADCPVEADMRQPNACKHLRKQFASEDAIDGQGPMVEWQML